MPTRFQTAIREGAVDVTNLRDESRFRGTRTSRVVAKPKPGAFATRDELNRAIARARITGVLPAAQFSGTFRLDNTKPFQPTLGPGRLAPASLKGLVARGDITKQQTDAVADAGNKSCE